MNENAAQAVFLGAWWVLMAIAVVAQIVNYSTHTKRRADSLANVAVTAPFIFAFGGFYLGGWWGTFEGSGGLRVAGAATVAAGLALYVSAHVYLGRAWSFEASIKEGQRLVTRGPYRYVRHPMYSATALVLLGSGLLVSNYLMLASVVPSVVIYYARARCEEALLASEFQDYGRYARATKMFVPKAF
jgi:protein-S-isoprenylcysteine O-methyltransferase Ste14